MIESFYKSLDKNYGVYVDKVPQEVLNELKPQIDHIFTNFEKLEKYNDKLAGEIEHEYKLVPSFQLKNYIKELTQKIENKSQYISSNFNPLPTLQLQDDLWVNFQKKYEYNPVHCHSGIYSFVIWYQIPYLFENEKQTGYKTDRDKIMHGQFQFIFPNYNKSSSITLNTMVMDIDKTKEGYIAIFPSTLHHCVYPFYTSNDYRITVAGNITAE